VYRSINQHLRTDRSRIHYSFNLHSLMKLLRGVQQIQPSENASPSFFLKIWKHEMMRVFGDSLLENDRRWLQKQLNDTLLDVFKTAVEGQELEEETIFTDFSDDNSGGIQYRPEEIRALVAAVQEHHKGFANLILHDSFINHLARVVRILKQPVGH